MTEEGYPYRFAKDGNGGKLRQLISEKFHRWFGFTSLYIERCIVAAQTYDFIEEYLKTNGLDAPYPTKQRQLRPIFQAHLSPIEVGEVWVMAVNLYQLSKVMRDLVK